MTIQPPSPFGSDCCTVGTICAVSGQLINGGDTIAIDIGAATSLLTLQITGMGGPAIYFEYTVDGVTWIPKIMTGLDGSAIGSQTAVDGLWQGGVAGYSQFRVRADNAYAGTAAQVTLRTTDAPVPDPQATAPLTWNRQDVTLDGTNNQILLAANDGRRAFMLLNPQGNSQVVWSPSGDTMPTLNDGIPLIAGANPTVFTYPECGTGPVTVRGTAGNVVHVYRGV